MPAIVVYWKYAKANFVTCSYHAFRKLSVVAEGVGFSEKSAVLEDYFSQFLRLLNHYPVTIPPLPPYYP